MKKFASAMIVLLMLPFESVVAQSDEQGTPTSNSKEFLESFDASIKILEERNFGDSLESPSLNAITDPISVARLKTMRDEKPITGVSTGESGLLYDVILQPGHYLRTKGAVGTAGKSVSERALVAYITGKLAERLRSQSISVLIISADDFLRGKPGLQGKIFLAIHADGNKIPCSSGPSMGYERKSSMLAMHTIGLGLSQALGYQYNDFMRDNLTVNESKYYMFSQVRTTLMKGLLEIGELTCEAQEDQLVINADSVAANLARALNFLLAMP